ncbi:hypothetical protein DBB30_16660 [Yersinia pestis]|nr:hypothetical protein AVO29_19830 [Yersinia pestis]PVF32077.1 hypothetical protein A9312_17955 [Yersinia pestis]PWF34868.1 hypothetical protein DBB30_16660 [Yersinia pestis]
MAVLQIFDNFIQQTDNLAHDKMNNRGTTLRVLHRGTIVLLKPAILIKTDMLIKPDILIKPATLIKQAARIKQMTLLLLLFLFSLFGVAKAATQVSMSNQNLLRPLCWLIAKIKIT